MLAEISRADWLANMFCKNGMPNNQKTPGHYNPLLFVVVVLRTKNPGILPIYIVDEKFELTNSTSFVARTSKYVVILIACGLLERTSDLTFYLTIKT